MRQRELGGAVGWPPALLHHARRRGDRVRRREVVALLAGALASASVGRSHNSGGLPQVFSPDV